MALKKWSSPIDEAMDGFERPQYKRPPSRTSGRGTRVAQLTMVAAGQMMHLECGYNKAFIDALKQSIPSKKRYYDVGDTTWYIVTDQFEKLSVLMDQYFDQTILVDFPKQHANADSWTQLWLLEGAPLEVVNAVYKTLAKLHHPDVGGDAERMKHINLAYKDILGIFAEQNGNGHDKEKET